MNPYIYEIRGMYSGTWETVTRCETATEADEMRDTYRRNEPGTAFVSVRVLDTDTYGLCDICGDPYTLGGDDHNPETGNHQTCEGYRTVIVHGREAHRQHGMLWVATLRAYAITPTGDVHQYVTRRPIPCEGWETWHETTRAMITRAGGIIRDGCRIIADVANVTPKALHNGGLPYTADNAPGTLLDPL